MRYSGTRWIKNFKYESTKLLVPLCYLRIIHKNNGPGGPLPSESRVTYTPTFKVKELQLQKSVFNVS